MINYNGSSFWNPVEDGRIFGVAKYHFQPNDNLKANHAIQINFGETVRIKGESREWFFVEKTFEGSQSSHNESKCEGILPKSYIHILDCSVSRHGDGDVVIMPKCPPVVQEITFILREWHRLAKILYLTHNEDLVAVRGKILVLHDCRRRIMYPNLTKDGLRELKKQVASVIDSGNHLLKLDMTVRDENGNPLNPTVTSTIELFRQHQKSAKKLKKQRMKNSQRKSHTVTHHSHSLLVNLEKISWRIVDKCEIRVFLFDANQNQPFSESAQFTMRVGESPNLKLPTKFLFTDLGKKDMERKKVYLVAYVVRIGAMEYKEPEVRRENTPFSQRSSQEIRRPWGVAARDITYILKEHHLAKHDKEELIYVPYIPFGEYDCLESALHKLFSAKEPGGKESRNGLTCMVSFISGTPAQIQEEQPILIRGNPIITRKMGFPEVILPNDVRNDLYVRLFKGEFHHRGAKTTDKNIEVTVSALDVEGKLLKGLIFGGSGCPPSDEYKSIVYYHDDKPKWYEIFKISLPISIDEFSAAHLKFTFKHRSSSETKDKQEKPFAISYVPLRNKDGTAIADGLHELFVYKLDPKHYKEGDLMYLKLPIWRQKPWEQISKPQCPGFSMSNKDYFQIQTTLCSTKFTQNAQLLELLQWSTKLKNLAERNAANYMTQQKSQEEIVEELFKELKQVIVKVTTLTSGDEIVKFLPDVFDALFLILVDPIESIQTELGTIQEPLVINKVCDDGTLLIEMCDRAVFECLIYIFGLILDHKYQNFHSVLSLYIMDGFSSALAYKKLIKELQHFIENADDIIQLNQVLKIMKSIEYFFKFIIRSFNIRTSLRYLSYQNIGHDGDDGYVEFERSIEKLFGAMSRLLRKKDEQYLTAQGGCLKYIPAVVEHLCTVFSARKLSELLFEIIMWVPCGKLTKQKLTTIKDIVHSPLFLDPACRTMLWPIVAQNIQEHLPGNDADLRRRSLDTATNQSQRKLQKVLGNEVNERHTHKFMPGIPMHSEETEKCVELLSDVMDILFRQDIGPTEPDISYLLQTLLRPIIFSIGTIGETDELAGDMVSILLSMFRQMNNRNYSRLINGLKGDPNSANPHELRKFLNDVLVVKKNLFAKPYFPLDWSEMILLQNSIVVGTLDHFCATIKAEYADPFEEQPWNNFFQSAVSFLTQKSLQLEEFSENKRLMTKERYGDMRKKAGELIRAMWFSLGVSKRRSFVPTMVGTFLDMTLVPEPELRRSTIPIFFDMMHSEFDGSGTFKIVGIHNVKVIAGAYMAQDLANCKSVEDELIKRLVEFVENGKGDRAFRDIFHDTMTVMCENDNSGLRSPGLSMVHTITRLLDLLLEYREVVNEDDPSNRMTCIVNLLDFSQEIDRKDLYLRYLYKLHDLHTKSNNFTEAAFTLKLHSRQLDWTDDEIPRHLQSPRYPSFTTQFELKEALYNDIIKYLMDGKMWECALEVSDELRVQAEESYNYTQLPYLLRQMATFYEEIMKKIRVNPTYFRVAFYGRGFPSFLQDKSHIYRGKEYEQLTDFQARILCRYPQAELLGFLTYPSEELRYSNKQLLQICKVDPVMGTSNNKRMSAMKNADECVRNYYRTNEIEKFTYSRPYHREPRETENEFSSLWLDRYTLWTSQSFPGIMTSFPVVRETSTQVRPIIHAIEELEKTNQDMRELIITHWASPNENIGPLSMKLNGILDAAVMGGIANYEKAFLTPNYLERHPDDFHFTERLKNIICSQVPILEQGLKIHEQKAGEILMPLHRKIEQCFQNFLEHVEKEYSVKFSDLKDATLMREIGRAQKKRQMQIHKEELAQQMINAQAAEGGLRKSTPAIARSMGSFSSTMSLYSNTQKVSGSKSMHSVSRYDTFRRSTQGSVSEIHEFAQSSSATLPRNGIFFGASSSSANSSHSLNVNVSESEAGHNKSKDTVQAPLIPLTQTLTSQRPLRAHAEQRKSQTWFSNGDGRNSGISVSSCDTMLPTTNNTTPDTSSRNSVNFPDNNTEDDDDTDTVAPPLPPKQRGDGRPPTPPPKKPPLRRPF